MTNPTVALLLGALLASQAQAQERVDTALVIAIDSSNSIEPATFNLQFHATLEALESPPVLHAIRGGHVGCIAASIVTWSNRQHQDIVADWTRICSGEDMAAFTGNIKHPFYNLLHHHGSTTSITGAIDFSIDLLESCPFPAERQVIDISGNGVESSKRSGTTDLKSYRDQADSLGIVINGLPMLTPTSEVDLPEFYYNNVITSTGFIIVATSPEHFRQAIERKFWLEIAAPLGARENESPPPPPRSLHRRYDGVVALTLGRTRPPGTRPDGGR